MAALRALSGVALLILGTSARGSGSSRGIVEEDAAALVQVSLESTLESSLESSLESTLETSLESGLESELESGIESLIGVEKGFPARKKRNSDFPLTDATHEFPGHFVGSAAFTIDAMGFHVHCYDIAMYLDTNSSLWKPTPHGTREERMNRMLGGVFFEIIAHSKWVNNKNMAEFVDRLEYFAKEEGLTDYEEPIATYKQAYLKAPKVTRGSHIVLFPSREGVRPMIGGKDMGLITSDFLGRLVMKAYLGPQSDLPEFRDNVFAQLSSGKPAQVGAPAEVHAQSGRMAWTIVIFVVVAVALTACVGCGCWYCCRRSKADASK